MAKKHNLTSIVLMVVIIVGGLIAAAYLYSDLLRGTRLGEWMQSTKKPFESSSSGTSEQKTSGEKKVLYWVDPKNPAHKSDKPGKAPDGMDLVPVYADEENPAMEKPKEERKILYWVDPMNPAHKSDKPGKAPDGMDLVPVYADEAPAGGSMPPGTVKVSSRRQQLIGVSYGEVTEQPLTRTIRTVGRLVFDETRLSRVQTRVEGWIDQVFVDFTGQLIKKNQPLITIYSPEMVSTQQELLIAKKAKDSLGKSEYAEIGLNASSLYNSTRQRLRLWNISDRQVKEIERRGEPITALTLSSPMDGFVVTRNAFPGQRVTPETELYAIADLSTIWVMADVYEYEVPMVQIGQPATMSLSYFPGETFRGKVTYIYPQLDNMTRTLKVRLQFPNPGFKLKPDMYANVELKADYGKPVSVPEEAVLNSGTEQVVFVDRGDGYFEPRKVELGAKVDKRYIILNGLKAGEKIITSGNFLIDSESKLKSATEGMAGGAHAGHGEGISSEGESKKTAPNSVQPPPKAPARQPDHSQHERKQGGGGHDQ